MKYLVILANMQEKWWTDRENRSGKAMSELFIGDIAMGKSVTMIVNKGSNV